MAAGGFARALTLISALLFITHSDCWNDGGAVLLRDVQVLTLYRGRYTTARRSSPVAQLQCVGGSAGCSSFVPDVVQCQNRGWDGVDVQWECKADMDNGYRFGRVEVSCEGYSSPDDPYILKGSCGLEYTLELTAEGRQQRSSSSGFGDFSSFFQGGGGGGGGSGVHQHSDFSSGAAGSLTVFILLLLLAYAVYKVFLGSNVGNGQHTPQGEWPRGPAGGMQPPPPGFKPDYTDPSHGFSSSGPSQGFNSSYTGAQAAGTGFSGSGFPGSGFGHHAGFGGRGRGGGGGGGGGGSNFWSGLGTGGLLGYLFGNNRHQPPVAPNRPFTSTKPSTSSGTRTASGFGGTKRR